MMRGWYGLIKQNQSSTCSFSILPAKTNKTKVTKPNKTLRPPTDKLGHLHRESEPFFMTGRASELSWHFHSSTGLSQHKAKARGKAQQSPQLAYSRRWGAALRNVSPWWEGGNRLFLRPILTGGGSWIFRFALDVPFPGWFTVDRMEMGMRKWVSQYIINSV